MKKLLALVLAGLMMLSCMSLNVFADEEMALEAAASDGKVTLSWEDSGEDGYSVYWKRTSSETWKLAKTTQKHKINITGLKNGVSYDFKVEAGGIVSETVTAMPTGEALAILEYYGDGVYSEYTISDEISAEKLISAYRSLSSDATVTTGEISAPYYKITLSDYHGRINLYVSSENLILLDDEYYTPDDADYYALISDVTSSLSPMVEVEMPCSSDDFDFIEVGYIEKGGDDTSTFVVDPLRINSLLAMYYSLEYITEPTDEELVLDWFQDITTVSFEFDGERHYFYIDCYTTVTWDGADGNYSFTKENEPFVSASGYGYYMELEHLKEIEGFES